MVEDFKGTVSGDTGGKYSPVMQRLSAEISPTLILKTGRFLTLFMKGHLTFRAPCSRTLNPKHLELDAIQFGLRVPASQRSI